MPCLAARGPGWGAALLGCSSLSTAPPAKTKTQGTKFDNVPPQIPSKISDSASSKRFVASGMHLDSLLQKALRQTHPLWHFLLSNFPSLLKSCGTNHHRVLLGHNCPSLISNNIPEPQSGENREQWNTHARDHSKAGSPLLCL